MNNLVSKQYQGEIVSKDQDRKDIVSNVSVNREVCSGPLEQRQTARTRRRNKSSKAHWNPDFVYENLSEFRGRSSSWSCTDKVAVVERSVSHQKFRRMQGAKQNKVNVNKDKDNDRGNKRKPIDVLGSESGSGHSEKKVNQQRIDNWFGKTIRGGENIDDEETEGAPGAVSTEVLNRNANSDKVCDVSDTSDEIRIKVTTQTGAQSVKSVSDYWNNRGSDYKSLCGSFEVELNETISICVPLNSISNTAMAGKEQPEINYEQELKKLLDQMKSEMKTEMKQMVQELKEELKSEISAEAKGSLKKLDKVDIETIENDTKNLSTKLKLCELKLNEVTGVVIRQNQELNECKEKIEQIQEFNARKILRIRGLEEFEEENCVDVVKDFFKTKLKIRKDIVVKEAYRVGKGLDRLMKVVLKYPRDKGLIFGGAKHLKDVTNENDKPYFVDDQLIAKKNAERNRLRQIVATNRAMKTTADQLKMSRIKNIRREYIHHHAMKC